ncbi:MAG: EmrB/QacA family drug resistance transporter [Deltaproteobacteria bacterium RBG_13_52_11]|nr:MAG: EmrB/QacA family drug resistance transporter [Deltaproteobacteria bacterium RBG_13_52_11]
MHKNQSGNEPIINRWIIALTVMLPTLIEIIDTSVVNVSLDHIRGSLSAGIDEATWVITSYLVSNAIIIPITGWLSRLIGRKRYLILSISVFTVSSFMCGSAWSLQSLVVFRILQGIGGGALQPLSQSILLETFPPRQRGMSMAIFGVGVMFGPIVGPLLGGWITDSWSWHWIFFINVPIGFISIMMVLLFIVDPPYMERIKMKIDYWGLFLMAIGLGCLQIVLDKGQRVDWFSSNVIIYLSFISISSLILFVVVELFSENPVVNLRAFKNISFSTGNIIMFFVFFCVFGSTILLPVYLQTLMGYTSFLAGLALGPGAIFTMLSMPIVGVLVNKINSKAILAFGVAVTAYSFHLMAQFNLSADFNTIVWPRVLMGIGVGFFFIPLNTLTMSGIRKEEMGNATAIFNLLRNLGGSFGVAFITTMLTRRAQFHQARLVDHLDLFGRNMQQAVPQISEMLKEKGFPFSLLDQGSLGVIQGELLRQASMLSFNDAFQLLAIMTLVVLLIVPLMKKGKEDVTVSGMH